MPKSREQQINIVSTPYYHCISRCVRRAYLCGSDNESGKNYDHRREWIENRLMVLAQVFSINICAYAIMHNHTHIVLHIDVNAAKKWQPREVLERWYSIFSPPLLAKQFLRGEPLSDAQVETLYNSAQVYKQRLLSISWFMRALNEPIARMANSEDQCTGKFWEGRFKSQPLLDDAALLSCMAYVDLNPVRAKIVKSPEKSKYTSFFQRLTYEKRNKQPPLLAEFKTKDKIAQQTNARFSLPFKFSDYKETVLLSYKIMANLEAKKASPLMDKLKIEKDSFSKLATSFEKCFKGPAGNATALTTYYKQTNHKRTFGLHSSLKHFSPD